MMDYSFDEPSRFLVYTIAAPDGESWINPTGDARLASGGSGDVLTGLIASLIDCHGTGTAAAASPGTATTYFASVSVPGCTVFDSIYIDVDSIPQNSEQADTIKQAALLNPLINKNLLSDDGRVMAINVYFDSTRYFGIVNACRRYNWGQCQI